jgi:hypothetical protein
MYCVHQIHLPTVCTNLYISDFTTYKPIRLLIIPLTPFAFIAKAANLGPDLLQQSEIISNFQNEGGGHKTLQVCCVCGVNDFKIYLQAENLLFSEWWLSSAVKLNECEKKAYKKSRTEGYLNLSVLQSFAATNDKSLKWAY